MILGVAMVLVSGETSITGSKCNAYRPYIIICMLLFVLVTNGWIFFVFNDNDGKCFCCLLLW